MTDKTPKKKLYQALTLEQAYDLQGFLKGFDIETEVMGENLSQVAGEVPFQQALPTLWVGEDDYEKACELAREYHETRVLEEGKKPPLPSWKCPSCGEWLDGQFTHCWNCDHEREFPGEEK